MDIIETHLVWAGGKRKNTLITKIYTGGKGLSIRNAKQSIWNCLFFLKKSEDYSGGISYLVSPSTIVSSSLRGHVFKFLPLKCIFFLQWLISMDKVGQQNWNHTVLCQTFSAISIVYTHSTSQTFTSGLALQSNLHLPSDVHPLFPLTCFFDKGNNYH